MAISFLTPQSRTIGSGYIPPAPAPVTLLETYLASLPRLLAGKARKSLARQQGFSGKFMTRHAWAEAAAKNGTTISNGRVMLPNGCFYLISDVTKTAIDYLTWLQGRKD